MSKTTFTKGPWRVESLTGDHLPRGPIHMVLAQVNGYPSTVCTVEEYMEVPGFDADRLADAHLIAAAPTMLNALYFAKLAIEMDVEMARLTGGMQHLVDAYQETLNSINDAITLATGEQA